MFTFASDLIGLNQASRQSIYLEFLRLFYFLIGEDWFCIRLTVETEEHPSTFATVISSQQIAPASPLIFDSSDETNWKMLQIDEAHVKAAIVEVTLDGNRALLCVDLTLTYIAMA